MSAQIDVSEPSLKKEDDSCIQKLPQHKYVNGDTENYAIKE